MNIDELTIVLNYLKNEISQKFEIGQVDIREINDDYEISIYEKMDWFHKEAKLIKKYFTKDEIDYLKSKGE